MTTTFVDGPKDRAHGWAKKAGFSADVERVDVPCGPLAAYLRVMQLPRIDVWFLDVEGAEALTLQSVDWATVSVGLLSVEFASSGKAKNSQVLDLLSAHGFALAACVTLWRNHIYNLIFLRAAHYVGSGRSLPEAALAWLDLPRNRLPGRQGDRCPKANDTSVPYRLQPPKLVVI